MPADQLGHGVMAIVAAVVLVTAAALLWKLRQCTGHGGEVTIWRAGAWAQLLCGLVVLVFAVVQMGVPGG